MYCKYQGSLRGFFGLMKNFFINEHKSCIHTNFVGRFNQANDILVCIGRLLWLPIPSTYIRLGFSRGLTICFQFSKEAE